MSLTVLSRLLHSTYRICLQHHMVQMPKYVYNFTIFQTALHQGYCYLRNETEGAKDPTEIGLALLDYLKNLPQTVIHPATFSDTCSGQNRKFSTTSNLKIIDMKFIEPGNS